MLAEKMSHFIIVVDWFRKVSHFSAPVELLACADEVFDPALSKISKIFFSQVAPRPFKGQKQGGLSRNNISLHLMVTKPHRY